MASSREIMTRRSKRVSKGLRAREGGEGSVDQNSGRHTIDIDKAAVQNNDRHIIGQEAQSRKTSDGHNSDNAGLMTNQDSFIPAIRLKDIDNIIARGLTRKRNAKDTSFKSRKKGKAAKTGSFERKSLFQTRLHLNNAATILKHSNLLAVVDA